MLRSPEFQGVSYSDRWKMQQERHAQLLILVPKDDAMTRIADRAGIVGKRLKDTPGKVLVYFEGWVNGAMQYSHLDPKGQWTAGVEHAAGRMLTEYPTVACAVMDEDDFVEVGAYHCVNPTMEERIRVWNDAEVNRWIS